MKSVPNQSRQRQETGEANGHAQMDDSQKLDQALGLLTIISDELIAHRSRLEAIESQGGAVVQHVGGMRAALDDLRPRVERGEQELKRIDNLEKLLSSTHDLAARTAQHVGVPKLDEEYRAPIRRSEPAE